MVIGDWLLVIGDWLLVKRKAAEPTVQILSGRNKRSLGVPFDDAKASLSTRGFPETPDNPDRCAIPKRNPSCPIDGAKVRRYRQPRALTDDSVVIWAFGVSALPTGCTTLAPVGGPKLSL